MHTLMILIAMVLGPNMADDGYHYLVSNQLDAYRLCVSDSLIEDKAECLEWAKEFNNN